MKKPESRLQRRIKEALMDEFPGSLFFKIWGGPFQVKGIPDLVGCVDGFFVAIEVKFGKGEPTPYQRVTMKAINEAGGISFLAYSVEEAIDSLKNRLEILRKSKSQPK